MKNFISLLHQLTRQLHSLFYLLVTASILAPLYWLSPVYAQTSQQQTEIRYVDRSKGERNLPVLVSQPDYSVNHSNRKTTDTHAGNRAHTSRPLLWRIEHPDANNGIRSSYILGTIHLDDKRVMEIPDSVLHRLGAANTLMLELELNDTSSVNILRKMLFTDGRSLKQVLGEAEFNEVSLALSKAGSSLPQDTLSILKPWAAMLLLIRPENKSGTFLDKHLADIAKNSGIRIEGLETIDEQLSVFDDLELSDQIKLLQEAMHAVDDKEKDYQDLLNAYINGDLQQLVEESRKQEPNDKILAALLRHRLIDSRNVKMFERFKNRLRLGNVFIAIGALHLPGEQGLLNKIRQAGYRLVRVED